MIIVANLLVPVAAHAESIRNPLAVFAGLDKVTGKIKSFQIPIGGGALREPAHPSARLLFAAGDGGAEDHLLRRGGRAAATAAKRIFSGWMLAESPGLNAVEHPVYDVWLTGCRDPNAPKPLQEAPPPPIDLEQADVPKDND